MIYTNYYKNFPYNYKEIKRYLGYRTSNQRIESVESKIEECINELDGKCSFQVCYSYFPIIQKEKGIDLTFSFTNSLSLQKNLESCEEILIFAATIGMEIDRLITKYSKTSLVKSVIFQAIGAERVETLCDFFNEEIKQKKEKENLYLRPRFSPGYGDCPLTMQKDFFKVLDCERKIGLTLNDSLIMSPSKSVTAIIGISKTPRLIEQKNCNICMQKDCAFCKEEKE